MAAEVSIIVGPAHSGKTEQLLAEYRRSLRGGQAAPLPTRCLWLAPSQTSVNKLRDALVGDSATAWLDPGICTFAGFAESIIAASARRIRPISHLQKRFLLQRVVERALQAGELAYYAAVARSPGFLVQLDGWIAEMKRQDAWAEPLKIAAKSPRERELAQLYGEYQRLLTAGDMYDAEGRFWAAREILQASQGNRSPEYAQVVVHGFSDFTSAQYDILHLLAERSDQMRISLLADLEALQSGDGTQGRALLFGKTRSTFQRLGELFPQMTVEAIPPEDGQTASLRRAERHLFRDDFDKQDPTAVRPDRVEILAANGAHSEFELVAGRIKKVLHEQQAAPQDVVIVIRHLAESAERISEVLSDFEIPFWIEVRPRLAASPLLRTVLSLLRLQLEDWPFRRLLEVAGNRSLAVFDEPSDSQPRVCLERSIRAAQLPSGRKPLLEQLEKWSAAVSLEPEEPAKQATVALGCLRQLAEGLERLPERATIAEWDGHLANLLKRMGALGDPQQSAAWLAASRALHTLALVDPWLGSQSFELGLDRFVELMRMVADEVRLPAQADHVGRVRVLSAESARHESARHVYLVGLGERSFSSAERVGQLNDQTARTAEDEDLTAEQGEAMFLFYSLVTRATESLTLSYPALDDKGQQLPPSPMLTELKHCFRPQVIPETIQPLGEVLSAQEFPWSRSAHRQMSVARALGRDQTWLAGLAATSLGQAVLSAMEAIAGRAKRDQFGPYEGILPGEAAQAALARQFDSNHLWSPSQLEEYAICPWRFFAEQLLKLEPLGEMTLASDARRRGSLLHQVLASVHQQLSEQQTEAAEDEPWRDALAERFREALAREVAANPLGGLQQSLREIERRELEAWAPQYARQEQQYRQQWRHLDQPPQPAYFEVRFGPEVEASSKRQKHPGSTPLPFELDLGEEQIRITGQIDRIDVGRLGELTVFNVIDYKSGREVTFKNEAVRKGRQLQLPLYALAAEQLLLADQDAVALAAGYWSVQGKGFEKGALKLRDADDPSASPSHQWQEIRPQMIDRVKEMVTDLRAGRFPVYNEDDKCTSWCSFSTICRVGQIRSLEKPWPPPEDSPE